MSRKPAATTSMLTSIVDEVVNSFDLRSAFTVATNHIGRPDEGGDNEENNDEGTGGDDGGDEGSSDTGGDGTQQTGDDIKDPEKKRLHDEAARYRNERNALKQEVATLQQKQRELDDKEKSELEKAQRDLKEATQERDKLTVELTEAHLELSFFKSGSAAMFRDPADALKFLDLRNLKVDDDGLVPEKDIKKAADDLLKAKPYLGRGDDDSGTGGSSGQASGRETNGRKGGQKDTDRAALEKKYPALQGR